MLTVYLAMESRELVGCKIKGVRRILETLGKFGVTVQDEDTDLKLRFLFLPGAISPEERRRKRYEELSRLTREVRIR
ncbi:MAG: hypothetical protein ACP5XB_16800, partial [Isosphaeraceae bacterium]